MKKLLMKFIKVTKVTTLSFYFLFFDILLISSLYIIPQFSCEFNIPISIGFLILSLEIILLLFLNYLSLKKLLSKNSINKNDILLGFLFPIIFISTIAFYFHHINKKSNIVALCPWSFKIPTNCHKIKSIQ